MRPYAHGRLYDLCVRRSAKEGKRHHDWAFKRVKVRARRFNKGQVESGLLEHSSEIFELKSDLVRFPYERQSNEEEIDERDDFLDYEYGDQGGDPYEFSDYDYDYENLYDSRYGLDYERRDRDKDYDGGDRVWLNDDEKQAWLNGTLEPPKTDDDEPIGFAVKGKKT